MQLFLCAHRSVAPLHSAALRWILINLEKLPKSVVLIERTMLNKRFGVIFTISLIAGFLFSFYNSSKNGSHDGPAGAGKETVMPDADKKYETATLAGGCFWGMEEIIRGIPGVAGIVAGYTGGDFENPKYEDVKSGVTGHAEAVEIKFDPAKLSYGALLDLFFKMHDPTTPGRQGNDIGSQYRSAIFYRTPEQKAGAEAAVTRAQASGLWRRPIATEIVQFKKFWPAEEYHQDYLKKHPGGYTCHYIRK